MSTMISMRLIIAVPGARFPQGKPLVIKLGQLERYLRNWRRDVTPSLAYTLRR